MKNPEKIQKKTGQKRGNRALMKVIEMGRRENRLAEISAAYRDERGVLICPPRFCRGYGLGGRDI